MRRDISPLTLLPVAALLGTDAGNAGLGAQFFEERVSVMLTFQGHRQPEERWDAPHSKRFAEYRRAAEIAKLMDCGDKRSAAPLWLNAPTTSAKPGLPSAREEP